MTHLQINSLSLATISIWREIYFQPPLESLGNQEQNLIRGHGGPGGVSSVNHLLFVAHAPPDPLIEPPIRDMSVPSDFGGINEADQRQICQEEKVYREAGSMSLGGVGPQKRSANRWLRLYGGAAAF